MELWPLGIWITYYLVRWTPRFVCRSFQELYHHRSPFLSCSIFGSSRLVLPAHSICSFLVCYLCPCSWNAFHTHLCLLSLSLIHGFFSCFIDMCNFLDSCKFWHHHRFSGFFFFFKHQHFPPRRKSGKTAVCLACETCKQNSWDHSLNTTGHGTYCQSHSFPLLTIKNNVAVNTRVQGSICVYIFFFLGCIPVRVELLVTV